MNAPVVSIHANCGNEIGYGHVMRCLTVARELKRKNGMRGRFLMDDGSDASPVEACGFEVLRLAKETPSVGTIPVHASPGDGPLLLDTYTLTVIDLEALKAAGFTVAMFDDGCRLDDYPCGLVIDSAPEADTLAYRSTTGARFCLGPEYYPLRPEFHEHQISESPNRTPPGRLIVTFGGGDANDQTARVVRILETLSLPWEVTVILGPGYEGEAESLTIANANIRFEKNPPSMAPLMAGADIAISGAGGSAMELANLGTPSVLIPLSTDQKGIAEALGRAGAAISLNNWEYCTDQEIGDAILELANDTKRRAEMTKRARTVIDGHGAGRIAAAITETWNAHRDGAAAPGLAGMGQA